MDALRAGALLHDPSPKVWDPNNPPTTQAEAITADVSPFGFPLVASATNTLVTPANLKKEEKNEGLEMILPCVSCSVNNSDSVRQRAVIAVQMPAGITDPSQWHTEVVGDGGYLQFDITQHQTMTNPLVLSMAIPDELDPSLQMFAQNALNAKIKELCGGKRKDLKHTFKKKLGFQCEKKIMLEQPGNFGGCTFLLVVLQAVEQDDWNLKNTSNKMLDVEEKLAKLQKQQGL